MSDFSQIEDRLQDIAESFEELAGAIKSQKPPVVTVQPPVVRMEQPKQELKVTVSAPDVSVPVKVERIYPTKWEFVVTERDHNGRIKKFSATPIK